MWIGHVHTVCLCMISVLMWNSTHILCTEEECGIFQIQIAVFTLLTASVSFTQDVNDHFTFWYISFGLSLPGEGFRFNQRLSMTHVPTGAHFTWSCVSLLWTGTRCLGCESASHFIWTRCHVTTESDAWLGWCRQITLLFYMPHTHLRTSQIHSTFLSFK